MKRIFLTKTEFKKYQKNWKISMSGQKRNQKWTEQEKNKYFFGYHKGKEKFILKIKVHDI